MKRWDFRTCKLELNSKKTKIVYCRRNQKLRVPFKVKYQKFDFLGFTFKPRMEMKRGKIRMVFSPTISQKSISRITDEIRKMKIHRWVHFPISGIAELINSKYEVGLTTMVNSECLECANCLEYCTFV